MAVRLQWDHQLVAQPDLVDVPLAWVCLLHVDMFHGNGTTLDQQQVGCVQVHASVLLHTQGTSR